LKVILPLIVWTVGITFLLLTPTYDLKIENFGVKDKVIHIFFFGGQCFLLLKYINSKKTIITFNSMFLAVILVSSYGFLIECLQDALNTGRYFDLFDIIANISGSLIGSIIFYLLRKLIS